MLCLHSTFNECLFSKWFTAGICRMAQLSPPYAGSVQHRKYHECHAMLECQHGVLTAQDFDCFSHARASWDTQHGVTAVVVRWLLRVWTLSAIGMVYCLCIEAHVADNMELLPDDTVAKLPLSSAWFVMLQSFS